MRKAIEEFQVGESVEGVYLLRTKQLQTTTAGKRFLRVTLADKTGRVEGNLWEEADAVAACELIEAGKPVYVRSIVRLYNKKKDLNISQIRSAAETEYDPGDLMRMLENAEECFQEIRQILSLIRNPWLVTLRDAFLEDAGFVQRFMEAPAAKKWHDAYRGGLLEHTRQVLAIVKEACRLYPEIDRDLALMGAFLHDLGKVADITPDTGEYTLEGGLLGHISIGYEMLCRTIDRIESFPKDPAVRLKHILLSHHGELQFGSPILPATPEAVLVFRADQIAADISGTFDVIHAPQTPGAVWSEFIPLKNRYYLVAPAD